MSQLTRRRFGTAMLFSASAAVASRGLLAEPQQPATVSKMRSDSGDLHNWPKGYAPQELGKAVADHFVPSPHFHTNRIVYPEVCAWYGALVFARVTGDKDLAARLQARFEPLFTTENALLPPVGQHVDYSMFGALPLELYLQTHDKRYLDLGLKYADAQWSKPTPQGLTDETRLWIDDMYMITIVQVQAFRATGDRKYLDRAALEMATYLDKLQQPNGLFFHAPDVPIFWGRGNGWFAAGMTELLRDLPHDHPRRGRIEEGYRKMLTALLGYQTAPGVWRQLLDREVAWPETSGTGMFTFALVSGVRAGLLNAGKYAPAARRAWIGLAGYVDQNSDVTSVCEGTNKLNDLEYYLLRKRRTGDFHGQAPLLWTAAALLR